MDNTEQKTKEHPLQIRSDKTGIMLQKRGRQGRLNVIHLSPKEIEKLRAIIS